MELAVGGILGALISAVTNWALSRRRERSEVAHTDADTDHTRVETLDMSLQMYSKLFAEHKELMGKYQALSLRLIRIEKWAAEQGFRLPNGSPDG